MGKHFSCSASVVESDKYGECIQVQGDIQERFEQFVEKELAKYNVPWAKVKFEDVKKKKKAEAAEDDEEDDG